MSESTENQAPLQRYRVWDRNVRIFHWLNVICVFGLIALGLMIYFNKSFGVSPEGKLLLKTIHTYIGYVFALNLGWRIIWAFLGNPYSRWKAILPLGKHYKTSLTEYIKGLKTAQVKPYAGHNPLARLMVSALFLLLTTQAVTGLVLAGTDLYMPPFGETIKAWVATPVDDPSQLDNIQAGSKEGIDEQAYKDMRDFRKPFITVHEYTFYLLSGLILLHILGVVVTEVKEKNGLVSAMFTGEKVFTQTPVDTDKKPE